MSPAETLKKAKYFSVNDNWGDIDKVSPILIVALDRFRHELNRPLHISPVPGAVYAEKPGFHAENSWHYCIPGRNEQAMAADIFVEGDLYKAWSLATRCIEFGGVGIYPYASWAGRPYRGMLHLDIRPHLYQSRWWCDINGEYHYINDDLKELQAIISILSTRED